MVVVIVAFVTRFVTRRSGYTPDWVTSHFCNYRQDNELRQVKKRKGQIVDLEVAGSSPVTHPFHKAFPGNELGKAFFVAARRWAGCNRIAAVVGRGERHEDAMERQMNESLPLLILDLDETLIYGAEKEGPRPCDFRVGPFHVHKRPHLDEFLRGMGKLFNLAVWSSASSDYVAAIAARILPSELDWAFVWSRESCTVKRNLETFETEYIKDFKKVKRAGYDLARVLIVDDTRHKVARNYGNAIYVVPFEGDPGDEELPPLLKYLETLVGVENFRTIEKRGWHRA